MSLQRVFESARKLGVPLIVTDPSGRDPMVVITLEQFEALTEGATVVQNQKEESHELEYRSTVSSESVQAVSTPEIEHLREKEVIESKKEIEKVSLDERFYLEPLDDEGTV